MERRSIFRIAIDRERLVLELDQHLAGMFHGKDEMALALDAQEGKDRLPGFFDGLFLRPRFPHQGICDDAFNRVAMRPEARSTFRRDEPANARENGLVFGETSFFARVEHVDRRDGILFGDGGGAQKFRNVVNAMNFHRRPPVRCSSSFRPRRSNNPAALSVLESHDPFRAADPVVRGRALAVSDSVLPV